MKSVFLRHHGAFLAGLIDKTTLPISIRRIEIEENHFYELNSSIGLYVTYSTKRLSPWTVTFTQDHVKAIFDKMKIYEDFFLVIVCEFNFSAVINRNEISDLLSPSRIQASSITIRTGHDKRLAISGSEGDLKRKLLKSKAYDQILELISNA